MNLGENIHRYRTDQNMSQGDLAEALDVSRQSVSKWENNNAVPDLDKLVKMAELFGVTLDELVSGKSPAPPQPAPAESKPRFSRRETFGILFWCFAALIVLVYAMSGEGFRGLLPAIPFLICGCMCYTTNLRHLVLWCTWVFALPLIFTPFYEFIRIYEARLITAVLWLGMLILTLWCLRKEPVILKKHTKLLLILGYVVWLFYILLRILGLLNLSNLVLISDRTISYWVDAAAYLLFISLVSIITRLLKQHKPK